MTAMKTLTAAMVTLGLNFALLEPGPALAGPGQEALMQQALHLIEAHDYFRATRVLTELIAQPGNPYPERAQELLGNVREAAGQLAQAKAEYQIYLKKYPNGEGAGRVRARLQALLGGRSSADVTTVAAGGAPTSLPFGAANASVTDRGIVSLSYRFNRSASTVTDLTPAPGDTPVEADDTDNALSAGLQFTRIIANGERTIRLSFNGLAQSDFGGGSDVLRLSEALISVDNKQSGLVLTFGRQRVTPQGMGERTDGLTLSWPTAGGIMLGAVVGTVVNSTSDGLFSGDQMVLGASATFQDIGAPGGKLSVYYVGQTKGGDLYRNAVGAEYALSTASGSLSANLDYDLRFAAVNRAAVYGTWILGDASRITGRLSYYHGPGLNLANALIGQTVTDLGLISGGPYTEAQLTQIAMDRSAATTTAGLTWYRKLNQTWDLSIDGTLWETGAMPASAGVAARPGSGLGTYAGVDFLGNSVFHPGDALDLGLRYSAVGGASVISADASMRIPMSDALSLQPRLQLGHRDSGGSAGSATFVIPSLTGSYKFDHATSLNFQLGGQWSHGSGADTSTTGQGVFFSAGISRSF